MKEWIDLYGKHGMSGVLLAFFLFQIHSYMDSDRVIRRNQKDITELAVAQLVELRAEQQEFALAMERERGKIEFHDYKIGTIELEIDNIKEGMLHD